MRGRVWGALLCAALLLGCASEVARQPVRLDTATTDGGKRYELRSEVLFKLDSGYSRSVRANAGFVLIGRVPQGDVFRPTDTVLTVEGKHMHEAYAVVRDRALVGFYLPVEQAFSALSQAVPFPLDERKP